MENSQSDQQEQDLRAKADELLKLLAKRGIVADATIKDEARRAARQKRQKESFHNTILLLRNYRTLAWMLEYIPDTVAEELDRPFETVDELLDGITIAQTFGARKLSNRLSSIEQTRLLLDRVNNALTILKRKPDDGPRLYEVIYMTYITPERLSLEELQHRLALSARHYYRLRAQAVTVLSLRLWSTPDGLSDLWLDLLTLAESK